MFSKLLEEQIQNHLSKTQSAPAELQAFFAAVDKTYKEYEKVLDLNKYGSPEEIKELNLKLRNEAVELKKAHNELGRILNSVNHGFFSRDITTNNYIYLSVACERIYGYTSDDFFKNNRLWYDVILPEDRVVVETDNERLKKNEEVYTQYRIVHKDGSIRWLELTIIPFLKDKELTRVDGVVNDITKRKEVETEREMLLKELTRNNADLKQFSYITSHNLRAPLSNIQGILSLFDFAEGDDHNLQMLEMLKASADQLSKTIDDISQILVIRNNVNPELTTLSLEESFNHVLQIFTQPVAEAEGKVFTDFKSPFVILNKIYLESIFINLISNAIKYRSADRKLIIRVESNEDENGKVRIRFSDNGTGIDLTRHRHKIFGLYQRFHDDIEGQGLGLFIMKSQIEASGGKIDLESEPGIGTTFVLTFNK